MKIKHLALPVVAMMLTVTTVTAQTAKDVFDKSVKLTYLGIDFTKTKLIGEAAAKEDLVVENNFPDINQKVVNEPKRYDLAGAFGRDEVSTDIGVTNKRNTKADPDKLKSDNSDDYQLLKPEDVASMVKGYDFSGKTGVGVIFFMEGMNKTKKEVSMYVTFVDMKSRKVLFTERVEGKTGMAFGFSNYYLSGIKKAVEDIEKKKFKEWKSSHGG
ncbi:hypothetical protein [Chitinophaga sp. YIM B06452]|uniref:hypothetical protein n=1 Tax=Chitinophaga sp. YIM B06452 TaxID=3082158 RepID=UPI0031FE5E0D